MKQTGGLSVFLVMNDLPTRGGTCGIELVLPKLVQHGHRFTLFIRNPVVEPDSHPYLQQFRRCGLTIIEGSPNRGIRGDIGFLLKILVRVARGRPALFHVLRADSAWSIPWLKRFGSPVLYTEATNPNPRLSKEWWYPTLGRCIDAAAMVTAPTSAVKETLLRFHQVAIPILVSPFPVQLPEPQSQSLSRPKHPAIVTVGTTCRLDPLKGLDCLLEAAALITKNRNNIRFVIHGSGDHEASLQRKAAELELNDHLEFRGAYAAESDLPGIMSELDIFVFPSRLEGQPASVLEAMSYAKPVIATRLSGINDLAGNGLGGLVVEPDNPDQLADAICALADSPGRRISMGLQARQAIEKHCESGTVADRLLHSYQRVCNQSKKSNAAWLMKKVAFWTGRLRALLPDCRNPGGLFFFFRWAVFGGAENVHIQIVSTVTDQSPWIIFSEPYATAEGSRYGKRSQLFSLAEVTPGTFKHAYQLGLYSGVVNRTPNPVVFGSGSDFFYQLLPLLKRGARTIDLFHAFGMDMQTYARFAKWIDQRIAVSSSVANALENAYLNGNIDLAYLERVSTIANGVKYPGHYPRNNNHPFSVIFIGRGCEEKRLGLAGKVSRLLFERLGTRVVFVGENQNWVDEVDRPYCRFLGFIHERDELQTLLKKSDVILLTSYLEGMPLALLEAMAHGVVPVATNAGGVSDCIEDGRTGFLVEEVEEAIIVQHLVEKICTLAADDDLRSRMSSCCRKSIEKNYSAAKFNRAYHSLLSSEFNQQAASPRELQPSCRISVLIYRFGHDGLERTLESIFSNGFSDCEIRIIDDCSSDNEASYGKYLQRQSVFYCRHDRFYGYARSLNSLIAWSRGTLSILMNCGEILQPGALQHVWDRFDELPHAGMLQFPVEFSLGDGISAIWNYSLPVFGQSEIDIAPVTQAVRTAAVRDFRFPHAMNSLACRKWLEICFMQDGCVGYSDSPVCEVVLTKESELLELEAYLEARYRIVVEIISKREQDSGGDHPDDPECNRRILEDLILTLSQSGRHDRVLKLALKLVSTRYRGLLWSSGLRTCWVRAFWYGSRQSSIVVAGQEFRSHYLPIHYHVTDPRIQRNTGQLESDKIVCRKGVDQPGHCAYGPDFRVRETGSVILTYFVTATAIQGQRRRIVNLDVYDSASDTIIAERAIHGAEMSDNATELELRFSVNRGQVLEFRVWWDGLCDLVFSGLHIRDHDGAKKAHT